MFNQELDKLLYELVDINFLSRVQRSYWKTKNEKRAVMKFAVCV